MCATNEANTTTHPHPPSNNSPSEDDEEDDDDDGCRGGVDGCREYNLNGCDSLSDDCGNSFSVGDNNGGLVDGDGLVSDDDEGDDVEECISVVVEGREGLLISLVVGVSRLSSA